MPVKRGDKDFEQALIAKARELHLADKRVPAEWEPKPPDFFSPTLMVADLMTRVLPQREYVAWLRTYFTPAGIARLCQLPQVSDLSDYTIVHLVGLAYTRAVDDGPYSTLSPTGTSPEGSLREGCSCAVSAWDGDDLQIQLWGRPLACLLRPLCL